MNEVNEINESLHCRIKLLNIINQIVKAIILSELNDNEEFFSTHEKSHFQQK